MPGLPVPNPPRRRTTLADVEATIALVEDCDARLDALAARLAAAGRAEEAAYAHALLELGQERLALLRESRRRLARAGPPNAAGDGARLLAAGPY